MQLEFKVEHIVNTIKREIEEKQISIKDQYLATAYYMARMERYHRQKELVIVGAGDYGMRLYRMLEKEGISCRVKCFCDNSKLRQNTKYEGLEVLSTEEACERYPDAMFVITPKGYENEILRQLVKLNIGIEQISIYITALTGLGD